LSYPELVAMTFVFLGEFAKLQKGTISVVTSVRVQQHGTHWMDFHETENM